MVCVLERDARASDVNNKNSAFHFNNGWFAYSLFLPDSINLRNSQI